MASFNAMHRGKGNYYCIVPLCKNTSQNAPQVQFFSLPKDETRRNLWYEACSRKDKFPLSTNAWVCEDHFNLKDDVANYWSVQLVKARPRLRPTTVPSKFDCQLTANSELTAAPKRKKLLEGNRNAGIATSTATSSEDIDVTPSLTSFSAAINVADISTVHSTIVHHVPPMPTPSFSADLNIAPRPTSSFSADLNIAPRPTSSFSADLNIAPRPSSSFSAAINVAHTSTVKSTIVYHAPPRPTSSFSANLNIAPRPTSSFSAAINLAPSSPAHTSTVTRSAIHHDPHRPTSSFSADLNIAPRPTSSFSADLNIAPRPSSSFSAAINVAHTSTVKSTIVHHAPPRPPSSFSADLNIAPSLPPSFSAASNVAPRSTAHTSTVTRSAVIDVDSSALISTPSRYGGKQQIYWSENAAETTDRSEKESVVSLLTIKNEIEKRGRKVQTKHFRSKAIQVKSVHHDQSCSPLKVQHIDAANSPVIFGVSVTQDLSSESESESDHDTSDSSYIPSDESETEDDTDFKQSALIVARVHNLKRPMYYLGIREETTFLIDMLEKKINFRGKHLCRRDVITLILRKIRLNCPFVHLGDDYGIHESYAAKLFNIHIKSLSAALSKLVKWLSTDTVFANLPLAFWARYKYTYVIIDCFEIQIQTPGDPFDQSETWSDYKNTNTLKYLIGISPDGTIMFVSKGYLGRVSDLEVTLKSGFLDFVIGKTIMADRGFKNLEPHLTKVNATLIRPPSVGEGEVLDAKTSQEAKRIAALRIHVERSIGRLRQFSFLAPHATIPHQLQDCVNDAVMIACGLVNTHTVLTKL